MSTPTAINGQSGTVTFASGTAQSVTNWTANAEVEVLDTTTVNSLGWQQNINGIEKLEGNFEIPWDTAASPTGTSGLNFVPGATGTVTLLVGNTGKSITGPGRISKISVKNEAKGVVTFTCDFVSNGVWVFPT